VGRVASGATLEAPPLALELQRAPPLPEAALEITATTVVTTVYPPGATALRRYGRFTRDGIVVDTLRCFTPVAEQDAPDNRPLLLMIYPSAVDGWQDVSVGFASQGYPVLALSPVAARGVDMDAHAQDARSALELARDLCGGLDATGAPRSVVVLAGSFSSAIAYRFLRDEGQNVAAWISVGGIADAFSGTADFYAGRVRLPPWHEDAVPALGMPHLHPLPFLRYSPVYNAADLPPTLIIHTAADEVVPIAQARALEAALRADGVPVEAWYYEDTTHYLQIGAQLTDAGRTMFERILAFVDDL
jgi:pimeloyl-ACP methyl ester carboxylesterase